MNGFWNIVYIYPYISMKDNNKRQRVKDAHNQIVNKVKEFNEDDNFLLWINYGIHSKEFTIVDIDGC